VVGREAWMRKAIEVIRKLVEDGTVTAYAVGGGMAATFYAEPVLTYDLDVFIILPTGGGPLVSLAPVYERLGAMGYAPEREHVLIAGMPVQLIPAYNALVEEAVVRAVDLPLGDSRVRVVGPEYLLAIMVQTGRPKDRARAAIFLDEAAIDGVRLKEILKRHGLAGKLDALAVDRRP